MASSLSAKKRHRQNLKARVRNRVRRSQLKTSMRSFTDAIAEGDVAKAETALSDVAQKADRSAALGVIHANAAARKKARAQQRLNQLKAAGK